MLLHHWVYKTNSILHLWLKFSSVLWLKFVTKIHYKLDPVHFLFLPISLFHSSCLINTFELSMYYISWINLWIVDDSYTDFSLLHKNTWHYSYLRCLLILTLNFKFPFFNLPPLRTVSSGQCVKWRSGIPNETKT